MSMIDALGTRFAALPLSQQAILTFALLMGLALILAGLPARPRRSSLWGGAGVLPFLGREPWRQRSVRA